MSDQKRFVVDILFNSWGGTPDRLTREWIDYRLDIFFRYTLPSLEKQTYRDFLCYVTYDVQSEQIVRESLARHPALPPNVHFIVPAQYRKSLRPFIEGSEKLYRVPLPSDDMYHKDFLQHLHDYEAKPDTVALVPQYGYAYDSTLNRMGRFFFWLPSYGALIVDTRDFLAGKAPNYTWRQSLRVPHEFIFLKTPAWINHVHSRNMGTTFKNLMTWQTWRMPDAFALEPWNDPDKSRACFGPEVTDPDEMRRILAEYF